MAADAGLQAILSQYTGAQASRNGTGASVEGGLEIQLGRLANALDRQNGIEQARVQGVVPINVGPLDFLVSGGQPKLKAHRSSTSDNMSPQEGYIWFVTRLTLSGLNSGDLVNLHKPTASAIMVNATAVHTFTPTGTVGAGLGVADWEPGPLGLFLLPDDTLNLVSGGTLAATEIILTGQGIQIAIQYLLEYLL